MFYPNTAFWFHPIDIKFQYAYIENNCWKLLKMLQNIFIFCPILIFACYQNFLWTNIWFYLTQKSWRSFSPQILRFFFSLHIFCFHHDILNEHFWMSDKALLRKFLILLIFLWVFLRLKWTNISKSRDEKINIYFLSFLPFYLTFFFYKVSNVTWLDCLFL